MHALIEPSPYAIVGGAEPDYGFHFTPYPHRVAARIGDQIVAESDAVMVLNETRLAPVFYFPREHVRMDLMVPSARRTHCPFKGNARYWSLVLGDRRIDDLLWSYEDPLPEAAALAGYVAFYPELVDEWLQDGRPLEPLLPATSGHEANPLLGWLLREAPALASPAALTRSFAEQLVACGVPLWRLNIVIRTLHPLLMAVSYRWWRKSEQVEEVAVRYELAREERFRRSPLVPLFEGAGGIRRRLDGTAPQLDFPILEDLRAEGGTDYVAMPMVFSDGQVNAVTLASARPGGFSTRDLGHVYEVLDVLGRLFEVHALRSRATTLLDTYLGHHAGARVLDGLIKRGDGEDIHAVIWFCDLRESTPLARSMGRKAFLALLNAFFDCMAGAVIDHGGQVLRFIGDAALAMFPIPATGEPCAGACPAHESALDAALDACRRLHALNASRTAQGLAPIGFGIALHPGDVTYGNIGTESRLEFTVIGDAANRAARIESLCKVLGRELLVSEPFARRFPGRFESLGRHRLRGVDEALELFALAADGFRDAGGPGPAKLGCERQGAEPGLAGAAPDRARSGQPQEPQREQG